MYIYIYIHTHIYIHIQIYTFIPCPVSSRSWQDDSVRVDVATHCQLRGDPRPLLGGMYIN